MNAVQILVKMEGHVMMKSTDILVIVLLVIMDLLVMAIMMNVAQTLVKMEVHVMITLTGIPAAVLLDTMELLVGLI